MRDYVKSILVLAAMVLCSANGWAEDTTVDRFAITITMDGGDPGTKSPGEVKGEISADGNTATLTVKANTGYYIESGDIKVTKTVSGSLAQSRRLANTSDQGPALNPQIQLSSTQVNPKGTTEYTFAVTSAEYIYEVTADFHPGYEVKVPAGEYITYYSDEPLRIVDPNAELYTVSSVSGQTATLSGPYDALPANTPMLVHNTSTQDATILLIPCAAIDLYLTVYSGFTGTLTATTIAASDATTDRYAFNGKQFVWVKSSLSVAANKAWLAVPKSTNNARALSIVFEDTTPLLSPEGEDEGASHRGGLVGGWYNLNGRKFDNMPTRKGVYVFNGQKVVIK